MLFSMSKERNLSPGSKESMFSKEVIFATMSVVYFLRSMSSPVALMHDPMSMS